MAETFVKGNNKPYVVFRENDINTPLKSAAKVLVAAEKKATEKASVIPIYKEENNAFRQAAEALSHQQNGKQKNGFSRRVWRVNNIGEKLEEPDILNERYDTVIQDINTLSDRINVNGTMTFGKSTHVTARPNRSAEMEYKVDAPVMAGYLDPQASTGYREDYQNICEDIQAVLSNAQDLLSGIQKNRVALEEQYGVNRVSEMVQNLMQRKIDVGSWKRKVDDEYFNFLQQEKLLLQLQRDSVSRENQMKELEKVYDEDISQLSMYDRAMVAEYKAQREGKTSKAPFGASGYSDLIADIDKERERAANEYLMNYEGYRDASWKDVIAGTAKKGYETTKRAREDLKNKTATISEIDEDDQYKFIVNDGFQKLVADIFGLGGQFASNLTSTEALIGGGAGLLYGLLQSLLIPGVADDALLIPKSTWEGLRKGSVIAAGEAEAGFAYNELIEQGIDPDRAYKIATVIGGVNTALEALQTDELFSAFSIANEIGAGNGVLSKIAVELEKRGISVLNETGQELLQEGVTIAGTQVASLLDQGTFAYTDEEVKRRLFDTALSTLGTFGVLESLGLVGESVMNGVGQKLHFGKVDPETLILSGLSSDSESVRSLANEIQSKWENAQELSVQSLYDLYQKKSKAAQQQIHQSKDPKAIQEPLVNEYGDYGAKVLQNLAEQGPDNFNEAVMPYFKTAYEVGRANTPVEKVQFANEVQQLAYDAGKMDYIMDAAKEPIGITRENEFSGTRYLKEMTKTSENEKGADSAISTSDKVGSGNRERIRQTVFVEQVEDMLNNAYWKMLYEKRDNWYENEAQWLAEEGVTKVADFILQDSALTRKYIDSISELAEGSFTLEEVLRAYQAGELWTETEAENNLLKQLNQKRTYESVQDASALSEETGFRDSRFYAPQKLTPDPSIWETANRNITEENQAAVREAQKQVLILSHTDGAAEAFGVSDGEMNQRIKQWGNYPAEAKKLSQQVNDGVAPENQWLGLQNSSIIGKQSVSEQDFQSVVGEIKGDSHESERGYITRVILAVDTHMDWNWLNFEFENSNRIRGIFGSYDDANRKIWIGEKHRAGTVAHEMGHALDYQWKRDLFGENVLKGKSLVDTLTMTEKVKIPEKANSFYCHFSNFVEKLENACENVKDSYIGNSREVFARFVAKFVEWVDHTAGDKSMQGETDHYNDHFTTEHYLEFVRLLQKKSRLDVKRLSK